MANSDYTLIASGAFAPLATLSGEVGCTDVMLPISEIRQELVTDTATGMALMVNDEIMQILAVLDGSLHVKRGCWDTIPQIHAFDSLVFVISDADVTTDGRAYAGTETVSVKVQARTTSALVPLTHIDPVQVTFDQRFARPYPPGQMKANGTAWFEGRLIDSATPLLLTWVGRNRVLQADQLVGHGEAGVSPEAGTTYIMRVYDESGSLSATKPVAAGLNHTYPAETAVADLGIGSLVGTAGETYTASIRFSAVRDGLESRQAYTIPFTLDLGNSGGAYDPHWANVVTLLHFDEASGAYIDSSSAAQTITASPTAPTRETVNAKFGKSIDFNGNSYLTAAAAYSLRLGTSPFTIEFWVRIPSSWAGGGSAAARRLLAPLTSTNPSAGGIQIAIPDSGSTGAPYGSVTLFNSAASSVIASTGAISRDVWHHVAFIRDASGLVSCFLDGGAVGSSVSFTSEINLLGSEGFIFGNRADLATYMPDGIMFDELRITNGVARSIVSAPISAFPGTGQSSPTTLSMLLHFDGSETAFNDSSTYGHALTAVNGATQNATVAPKFGVSSCVIDSDAYVLLPASNAFNFGVGDFTVEAWVYATGYSSTAPSRVLRFNNGSNMDYSFEVSTSSNALLFYGTASGQSSAWNIPSPIVGAWFHVAWVRQAGVMQAFLNGTVLSATSGYSPTNRTCISSFRPVSIGGGYNSSNAAMTNNPFRIDELRVLKGVAAYSANFTPPVSPF